MLDTQNILRLIESIPSPKAEPFKMWLAGLDNAYYKDYIITYIEKFGKATREEINNLIYLKLPTNLSKKNKNNRVRYIISQLKKENKIENEGSLTKSSWIIKK